MEQCHQGSIQKIRSQPDSHPLQPFDIVLQVPRKLTLFVDYYSQPLTKPFHTFWVFSSLRPFTTRSRATQYHRFEGIAPTPACSSRGPRVEASAHHTYTPLNVSTHDYYCCCAAHTYIHKYTTYIHTKTPLQLPIHSVNYPCSILDRNSSRPCLTWTNLILMTETHSRTIE